MRRLLVTIMLVAAALPWIPAVAAHSCAGTSPDCVCPAPNDGQAHSHAGPTGSCSSGPGGQASATPGGAKASPAWGLVGTLCALAGVALLARRG
jgi:hypothetical protein